MNNKKQKMPTKLANVQRGDGGTTKASREKKKKENQQLDMEMEEAKLEGQAMTNIVNTCKLLNKFHDLKQKGLVNELLMRQMLALGFTAEDLLGNYTEEELKTNIQKRGQVGGEAGCSGQGKNHRGKKRGRAVVDSEEEEEEENSSKK